MIDQCNIALEFFPEVALAQAKDLDHYYEKNGKVVGPLHGLPISLKDQLRVKVSWHFLHKVLRIDDFYRD